MPVPDHTSRDVDVPAISRQAAVRETRLRHTKARRAGRRSVESQTRLKQHDLSTRALPCQTAGRRLASKRNVTAEKREIGNAEFARGNDRDPSGRELEPIASPGPTFRKDAGRHHQRVRVSVQWSGRGPTIQGRGRVLQLGGHEHRHRPIRAAETGSSVATAGAAASPAGERGCSRRRSQRRCERGSRRRADWWHCRRG